MTIHTRRLGEGKDAPFVLDFPFPFVLTPASWGDLGRSPDGNNENAAAALKRLHIDERLCAAVKQVHGRHIVALEGESAAGRKRFEADGIFQSDDRSWAAVTVADCLPIAVAAPGKGIRCLLHSGWRGTGILADAVDMFQLHHNIPPRDLHVCIGPGISSEAYEVDESRVRIFGDRFGTKAVRGRRHLNLLGANIDLARRLGVKDLTVYETCTFSDQRLGSFRREGPERYTRMLAILGPYGAFPS